MKQVLFAILIVMFFSAKAAFGEEASSSFFKIDDKADTKKLHRFIDVLENCAPDLNLASVQHESLSKKFIPLTSLSPNLGFSKSSAWFRLRISNNSSEDWILQVKNPLLSEVDFYLPSKEGYSDKKTGFLKPLSSREFKERTFLFSIPPASFDKPIFVRVDSKTSLSVPFDLVKKSDLHKIKRREEIEDTIILTASIMALMLSLFGMLKKRRAFVAFAGFVIAIVLWHLSFRGFSSVYLFPENAGLSGGFLLFSGFVATFFFLSFTKGFFDVENRIRDFYYPMTFLQIISLILGFSSFLFFNMFMIILFHITSVTALALSSLSAFHKRFSGDKPASILSTGFSLSFLYIVLLSLNNIGWISLGVLASYIPTVTVVILFVFMLTALVERKIESLKYRHDDKKDVVESLKNELKEKEKFFTNIVKELKNPANGIYALIDSFIDEISQFLTNSQSKQLLNIRSIAKRMSFIINDFDDFASIKNRTMKLNKRSVNINFCADIVCAIFLPAASSKSLDIINNINPLTAVKADESRLQHVFSILLDHAINEAEAKTKIDLSAEVKGSFVFANVAFSMEEVPPEILETKHKNKYINKYIESDIMLSVAKKIIEFHGGLLEVKNNENNYILTFNLPLSEEPVENTEDEINGHLIDTIKEMSFDIESEKKEIVVPANFLGNRKYKILAVSKDPIIIQITANYLSLRNYTIAQAQSGSKMLELIAKNNYSLIILDEASSDISDKDLMKTLRSRYSTNQLPVLYLSSSAKVSNFIEAFDYGVNDYFLKPLSKQAFLKKVEHHLLAVEKSEYYQKFTPTRMLEFFKKGDVIENQAGDHITGVFTLVFVQIFPMDAEANGNIKANINSLNIFLQKSAENIWHNGGAIESYDSRGFSAIFQNTEKAVMMGIKIKRYFNVFRKNSSSENGQGISIVIHTGRAVVGIIGHPNFLECKILTESLTNARKLEKISRNHKIPMIITEQALNMIKDETKITARLLGKQKVAGEKSLASIYEVANGDHQSILESKIKTRPKMEKAIALYYNSHFQAALTIFEEIITLNLKDTLSIYYAGLCREMIDKINKNNKIH